ncbi:pentatricopeptide repeat-containing protein at4g38150 [Phtheirospermum japonicum]|uniref:Pentatricopeptide repeat-containing protein at4g38150 n=1 Tax=Phtheirospermum japonicum TaxID=374723 RepID=A0A830BNG2_9LAMI|nr:pentatricopeptide repeat-containing protein at4g38150 [Phtheirospermum japonicum]
MSIALRTKFRSLSVAHLLRSFSSLINDGLGKPPELIPNRPLRKQSSYPSPPSPRIPNHNRGRKIETQHSSWFKLGFELEVENPKAQPEKSDNIEEQPLSPPDDADEIFKKMKETGLIPNAVAMLDGLCKDELVQDAMKLFGLMREKGTVPEVVVYTAVVEGFCKAHKFDTTIRIFKKCRVMAWFRTRLVIRF